MRNYTEYTLTLLSEYKTGLVNDDWSSFDLDGDAVAVADAAHTELDEEFGTDSWMCATAGDDYTTSYLDLSLNGEDTRLQAKAADYTFFVVSG